MSGNQDRSWCSAPYRLQINLLYNVTNRSISYCAHVSDLHAQSSNPRCYDADTTLAACQTIMSTIKPGPGIYLFARESAQSNT